MIERSNFGIAISIHPAPDREKAVCTLSTWRMDGDDLATQLEHWDTGLRDSETNWSEWVRDVLVEAIERLKN